MLIHPRMRRARKKGIIQIIHEKMLREFNMNIDLVDFNRHLQQRTHGSRLNYSTVYGYREKKYIPNPKSCFSVTHLYC